jgi:hypothetical protein
MAPPSKTSPAPLQIRITDPSGSPESQGEGTAQSVTVSQAIKQSLATRVEIESAAALALAVESTVAAHDAVIGGDVVAGTLHALAAANYFGAASTGLKLVKTLREK